MNQASCPIITYVSDCQDENTRGRLKTRVSTYFHGGNVVFVGVSSNAAVSEYEAAINVVDVLDAFDQHPGIILANVARREGKAKRWPNGTPFGWVKVGNVNIFSTIDGYTLSLIQKLLKKKLTVKVYDIPSVVPHMGLDAASQERIIHTQFRSFDYLPRLAAALMDGADLPHEEFSEVPEMPLATCWVDSFGNVKTNILPEEVKFEIGRKVIVRVSENKQFRMPCYNRLKDIPDNVVALTIGSSGMGDARFLEIMRQGMSAAKTLGIRSGLSIDYVETVD